MPNYPRDVLHRFPLGWKFSRVLLYLLCLPGEGVCTENGFRKTSTRQPWYLGAQTKLLGPRPIGSKLSITLLAASTGKFVTYARLSSSGQTLPETCPQRSISVRRTAFRFDIAWQVLWRPQTSSLERLSAYSRALQLADNSTDRWFARSSPCIQDQGRF